LTVTFLLLAAQWPSGALAQAALDRAVGLDSFGKPLVLTKLTAADIGSLAAAARAPMGFESAAPGGPTGWRIEATGRPLRAVLDAIVAADSRYEWRDDDGVVVLRPSAAWSDRGNALYRSVGRFGSQTSVPPTSCGSSRDSSAKTSLLRSATTCATRSVSVWICRRARSSTR